VAALDDRWLANNDGLMTFDDCSWHKAVGLPNERLLLHLGRVGGGRSTPKAPTPRSDGRNERREVLVGSVYAALERLEEKGFVASEVGQPTPERAWQRTRSTWLAVIAGAWCGSLATLILLVFALTLNLAFPAHATSWLREAFFASGTSDAGA
jgi:hypothetical protein